jgi:hypothetical protein
LFSRGTIVLVVFGIIVAAIVGLSQFIQNQPPYAITVAVHPLAEDWMQSVVDDFNASTPIVNGTTPITVTLTTTSDMSTWYRDSIWSLDDHPDAWIPATSATLDYIESRFGFETLIASTARSPLVWGGFNSRMTFLETESNFDWAEMAQAVQTDDGNWASLGGESAWGFLKFAYPRPANNVSGLAVLLSGASYFHQTDNLTFDQARDEDFLAWMQALQDSVPNFQTLGSDPAAVITSRQTSAAEVALLPEVLWLKHMNNLGGDDPIIFHYPQQQFIFDFPLAVWDDATTSPTTRQAVQALADFIMAEGQTNAPAFGLRPADDEPNADATLFLQGEAQGILLAPDYGAILQMPTKNVIEILLESLE